jgi:hypothetical protein
LTPAQPMSVLGKACPGFAGLPLVDLAHCPGKAH